MQRINSAFLFSGFKKKGKIIDPDQTVMIKIIKSNCKLSLKFKGDPER